MERLIRQHGLQGVCLRRHWRTTIVDPSNAKETYLVKREFTADAPNRLEWPTSPTSAPSTVPLPRRSAGRVHRRLVGWSMSDRMTTPLVLSALEMGLFRRDVQRGQLTHHADHGSQYTSLAFSQRLVDAGIAASMGSVGDAYDNSMIESFWGTNKSELLYRHVWASRHDAEMAIFEWIGSRYDRERLLSAVSAALGRRLNPEQFEERHHERHHDQALATAAADQVSPRATPGASAAACGRRRARSALRKGPVVPRAAAKGVQFLHPAGGDDFQVVAGCG